MRKVGWETRSVVTFWLTTGGVSVQMFKSIRVKIPFETFIEITRDNIASVGREQPTRENTYLEIGPTEEPGM